ncbi:MAG TPA: hypothetical protein VLB73_01555 [Patescibacteria group bacterium]|nr:hypothetical protein [Patescibacteria group bacterium]
MELLQEIKNLQLDIFKIFTQYKLEKLKSELDEIVSNPKGYNELKNNLVAYNNFFKIVSQIYLTEQNRLQNSVKVDARSIKLSKEPFNKNFEAKLTELTNETPTNLSR